MKRETSDSYAPWVLLRMLPSVSPVLTAAAALAVVVTAIVPAGFALATGAVVGSIPGAVRDGLGSPSGHRLTAALFAVAALFVLQQVAGPTVRAVSDALGRRASAVLRHRVMAATLAPVGIGHLEDLNVLDQIRAAQSVGTGQATPREAVVGMANVAAVRGRGLASAALLIGFHWWLALAMVLIYGSVARLISVDFGRGVAALRGQPRRFRRSDYFKEITLQPHTAKEVRLFGLARWFIERFHAEWSTAISALWREREQGRWVGHLSAVAVLVSQGVAFVLLAVASANHRITAGQLTVFAGAVLGVASMRTFSVDNIHVRYGSSAVPAVVRLERSLSSRRATDSAPVPSPPAATVMPGAAGLRFKGVWFRYPGTEIDVCRGLNLEIAAGQSLAIVGSNGAGKTTLLKLLTRLYEPTAGRIEADGVDIADIDVNTWRDGIAVIFQDFIRYDLTLADNISFGAVHRRADLEALEWAANAAGIGDLVDSLPLGWETDLSAHYHSGVELSGGQWQRVALARALFAVRTGARLVILDEPTASLDPRAEAALYGRFLDLTRGLTTVLVSHRFPAVRRADRIVVVEAGAIVEDGDHQQLLEAGGHYSRMFRLQAALFALDTVLGDQDLGSPFLD